MKKYILKSMTDFVLEINKEFENPTKIFDKNKQFERMLNYALFLKRPLTLGMFVPCDLEGNVLSDPGLIPSYELQEYRKAKERVLFKGITISRNYLFYNKEFFGMTYDITSLKIEDLVKFNLQLTDNAAKMLGYEVV